ncbi:MAG: restriction endonuclease [Alkaliphilus sp.]|nr:restriction endonuclease [Alkaliphilus sp.]
MEKINSVFRSAIGRIRGQKGDRANSFRFKKYYLRTQNGDRGAFAKILDYLVSRIIIPVILFLFLYLKTDKLYLSTFIALVVGAVFYVMGMRNGIRRFQQIKEQKRRYVASQKIYNEIMNKTTGEMGDYIQEVFAPMGFNQFEFIRGAQKYILLKSLYKGNKVIIQFDIYRKGFDVELKEVKEFIYTMADNKMKKGILITASDFTKDSYDFINKLSKNYTLLLINREKLLKIIEQNGLFPDEEEIDEIIESKISKKENRLDEYKKIILSKSKIRGYIILALYLILTAWYTPYIIYYMIAAGFIMALAFITFIFNIGYNSEMEKDKSMDFRELLKNM